MTFSSVRVLLWLPHDLSKMVIPAEFYFQNPLSKPRPKGNHQVKRGMFAS
jgi:hypothetical protein